MYVLCCSRQFPVPFNDINLSMRLAVGEVMINEADTDESFSKWKVRFHLPRELWTTITSFVDVRFRFIFYEIE